MFLMSMLSPVCHLHYFTFSLPLMMALLAGEWEFHGTLQVRPFLKGMMALYFLVNLVPHLPGLETHIANMWTSRGPDVKLWPYLASAGTRFAPWDCRCTSA